MKTPRRTGRAGLVVDEVSRLSRQDAKPLPHVVRQQHIDIARDWCVIGEALYAYVDGIVKWGGISHAKTRRREG